MLLGCYKAINIFPFVHSIAIRYVVKIAEMNWLHFLAWQMFDGSVAKPQQSVMMIKRFSYPSA